MNRVFNADKLAKASCIIGDFIILKQKQQTTNLFSFIKSNYPEVLVKNNQLIDHYGKPIRIATSNAVNAIYVIVSSSGEDGIWETQDDMKREGYVLEEGHIDAGENLLNR